MDDNTAGAGTGDEKKKPKIDRETAVKEFESFCENNELEYDESAMNDEEKEVFSEVKRRFIKCCMAGRAEASGTSIKYIVSDFSPEGFKREELTLKRPGGKAFSATDDYNKKQEIHKLLAYMSAMTGKDVKYFNSLDVLDWKFISGIATLFLSL